MPVEEYDILAQLAQIIDKLQKAEDILIAHDKATLADPNMDVSEWNQTPNGRVIGLLGDAVEMIDALEV